MSNVDQLDPYKHWYYLDENKIVHPYEEGKPTSQSILIRRVACDIVGKYEVSTVFLTIDHGNWIFEGNKDNYQPILWETILFGQCDNHERHLETHRCSGTWQDAEAMHKRVVSELREDLENPFNKSNE